MKIKDKAELRGAQLAVRKAYVRPALKIFGAVGALTQAGSGANGEYRGPNMDCEPAPRSDSQDRC